MGNVLGELEPKRVWQIFEEVTKIPRCSKKEDKIREWVISWAKEKGLEWDSDDLGNLVVRKPATEGMENKKPVVIQGHLDMVCEKNADVDHDFDKDPLETYVDGDWVKAKGTTLGADNGIGFSMGMAIADSDDIPHPPLELLFTLDEETGLTGAMQLGTDLLKSDILINLDSEEDGAFTIGCAGGMNTKGIYKIEKDDVPGNSTAYKVTIKGLQGGHSGIEIHDERGNAIKMMARLLWQGEDKVQLSVGKFNAGSAHNAIPREAFAIVTVPNDKINEFESFVKDFGEMLFTEWKIKEPNLQVTAEKTDAPAFVLKKEMQNKLLMSLYVMHHGVYRNSPDIADLVQTSTNLATIETTDDEISVLTSQRSSVETEKADVANSVRCAFELGGARVEQGDGYPAWQPNMDSPILNEAKEVYKEMYGEYPKIEAIHAGLECGLIGEKYPHMDMLSFGPTLKEVHSPDEKISISTTAKCYNLLKSILANIPDKK